MVEMLTVVSPKDRKKHNFFPVERDGKNLLADVTGIRRKKGIDSVLLYRLEDGNLIFDRYERVSIFRKAEGYY